MKRYRTCSALQSSSGGTNRPLLHEDIVENGIKCGGDSEPFLAEQKQSERLGKGTWDKLPIIDSKVVVLPKTSYRRFKAFMASTACDTSGSSLSLWECTQQLLDNTRSAEGSKRKSRSESSSWGSASGTQGTLVAW